MLGAVSSSFGPIFAALEESSVRYVVVGGLAVVLHGYARLTADVDLVVDLAEGEAIKAVEALTGLGMVPRAPVAARDFADPDKRRAWVQDKGMRVFSMHDPRKPLVEVDLFVDPPFLFEELYARAEPIEIGDRRVRVASIEDLIEMKRRAGRPQDEEDVAALRAIARRRRGAR
jgi:predicted nucleotidyltransferase